MNIVSIEWLKLNFNNDLVIVDTRGTFLYRFGHLENALSLPIEKVISISNNGSNLVLDSMQAQNLFGSMGIDDTKHVVVYGEPMDPSLARVAWTLLYHGHKNTSILDLGFSTIHGSGLLPITKEIPKIINSDFVSNIDNSIRADESYVKSKLNDPSTIIVDSRTPQEHFQARIPNSRLQNWEEGIGLNGRIFLSDDELQKIFKNENIPDNSEIICYCHSGTRASHKFFQFKYASFKNVKVYDGSIIDWAQRRNPLR